MMDMFAKLLETQLGPLSTELRSLQHNMEGLLDEVNDMKAFAHEDDDDEQGAAQVAAEEEAARVAEAEQLQAAAERVRAEAAAKAQAEAERVAAEIAAAARVQAAYAAADPVPDDAADAAGAKRNRCSHGANEEQGDDDPYRNRWVEHDVDDGLGTGAKTDGNIHQLIGDQNRSR